MGLGTKEENKDTKTQCILIRDENPWNPARYV